MNSTMKLCVVALSVCVIVACLSVASAEEIPADFYAIAPGPVDDPDIAWAPRIPALGDRVTLSARVRGTGGHPVQVRFVIEAPDVPAVVRSARPVAQPDAEAEYRDYRSNWQPEQSGIYTLTVQVDPRNKSGDPLPDNNTATVTIPVVWRELHTLSWGPIRDSQWVGTVATTGTSGKPNDPSAEEVAYWHRRGTKVLGYAYTIERNFMKLSAEEAIAHIVNTAAKFAHLDCDGLIIDEIGSYNTAAGHEWIRRYGIGYDQVHEKYPRLRVYEWIGGGISHPDQLDITHRNNHVLMSEDYPTIHGRSGPWEFAERLEWRGQYMASVDGIHALGIGGDCGRRFPPDIENNLRLCRKINPALPGICYYAAALPPQFLDQLTFDYFIKPVLMVGEDDIRMPDASPHSHKPVALQVDVHNIGGVPAKNVGVRIYARDLDANKRRLLAHTVIPQIGNGPHGTAQVSASWTPDTPGEYEIEVELAPAQGYTLLAGYARRVVAVTKPGEALAEEPAPAESAPSGVVVTDNDFLLSDYSPHRNQPVAVQMRVWNAGETPAKNVAVKLYARRLATNERVLLTEAVIPEIGKGWEDFDEEEVAAADHKIIAGTKHPIARWSTTTRVLFNRALVDATWTPQNAGYYSLEAEIQPSEDYVIGSAFAATTIAAGG